LTRTQVYKLSKGRCRKTKRKKGQGIRQKSPGVATSGVDSLTKDRKEEFWKTLKREVLAGILPKKEGTENSHWTHRVEESFPKGLWAHRSCTKECGSL